MREKYPELSLSFRWPWPSKWWKPKSQRRDLVRAGALILAEIERLDRQQPNTEAETRQTAQKGNP